MSSKVKVLAVADVHGEFSTVCRIPDESCVVIVAVDHANSNVVGSQT